MDSTFFAKMGLTTLKLEYNSEEDFDAIQNQLKNENVDHIDFTAFEDAAK